MCGVKGETHVIVWSQGTVHIQILRPRHGTSLEVHSTPVVSPACVCPSQQTCGADILGQSIVLPVYDLHPGAHTQ